MASVSGESERLRPYLTRLALQWLAEDPEALHRAIEDSSLRHMSVEVNRKRVARSGDRETNMGILAEAYSRLVERRS